MIGILNKILANQLDPEAVMAKLDEILKAVNSSFDYHENEVGQSAIHEANTIERDAIDVASWLQKWAHTPNHEDNQGVTEGSVRWRYDRNFRSCCLQQVKDLRSEIAKLEPEEMTSREKDAFDSVEGDQFLNQMRGQQQIDPYSVIRYAPYLRNMGVKLKLAACGLGVTVLKTGNVGIMWILSSNLGFSTTLSGRDSLDVYFKRGYSPLVIYRVSEDGYRQEHNKTH